MFKTILLAHHGTEGAELAEQLAFRLAEPGTRLVQLLVVPDLWAGMQGDDWLNNASTRDDFGRYVEQMLEAEAAEQIRAVRAHSVERGLAFEALLRVGDPSECLLEAARETGVDLVLIGPPRPKGMAGLRSRMDLDKLTRGLRVPLLVASRPQ
jgi:nucleotide-binding universal stress UspA family protein